MRTARPAFGAMLLMAATSLAAAQTTQSSDWKKEFAGIRHQLASSDFAQREAGQKLLNQMPPDQVELLREQAAAEPDPEVNARLQARVDAMDGYLLVHPSNISLDVQNATLAEVATKLNAQLNGGAAIQSTGANNGNFTLSAKNQPFWEIISQLNKQSPMNVSALSSLTVSGTTNTIRLSASSVPREYRLADTFALSPQVAGTPATGTWSIRFVVLADPRVRIAQYSQLRLEKLVDQDGVSLMPLVMANSTTMSNPLRPVVSWSASASVNPAPGVTRIKELRGAVAVSVLDKERVITLDLTKDVEPLVTPKGVISIDRAPGGAVTLQVTPVDDPAVPALVSSVGRSAIVIRASTANGSTLTTTFSGARASINLSPGGQPPSKVEISWAEKTRDMMIPIEWTDLAVPAPAVQPNPANPVVRPLPMELAR